MVWFDMKHMEGKSYKEHIVKTLKHAGCSLLQGVMLLVHAVIPFVFPCDNNEV